MSPEIFVFGSNLRGVHGLGAAWSAWKEHGAIYGQGVGLQGESYAIPTKDEKIETLPLTEIRRYVDDFKVFASRHPELTFKVTRIGCGLAGYKDEDIAPMFVGCSSNVEFFDGRWPYVGMALEYCKTCTMITWHDHGCVECKNASKAK